MRWLLPLLLVACRSPAPEGKADTSRPEPAPLEFVERVTGGASGDATLPLVIAVHGLGDRPERFVRLFERLPFPVRVVAPRGPAKHGRGYSWFPVRRLPPDPNDAEMVAGIRASAERLAALARWLAKHRPTRGKPVVTGFSQGGMLSFALAVHHPDAIAAALPVSGALPPALLPEGPVTRPIHALHGTADRVVPFRHGEATARAIAAVTKEESRLQRFPGVGHTVSPEMRAALYAALKRHTR